LVEDHAIEKGGVIARADDAYAECQFVPIAPRVVRVGNAA
jgi:hypothetical protein